MDETSVTTGRPEGSDGRGLFVDGACNGDTEDKCDHRNEYIQQDPYHDLVTGDIFLSELHRHISVAGHVILQLIIRNNTLAKYCLHVVVGQDLLLFLLLFIRS